MIAAILNIGSAPASGSQLLVDKSRDNRLEACSREQLWTIRWMTTPGWCCVIAHRLAGGCDSWLERIFSSAVVIRQAGVVMMWCYRHWPPEEEITACITSCTDAASTLQCPKGQPARLKRWKQSGDDVGIACAAGADN